MMLSPSGPNHNILQPFNFFGPQQQSNPPKTYHTHAQAPQSS